MKKESAPDSVKHRDKVYEGSAPEKLLPKPFPVVGFGASAGGLEAFTKFVEHLDANLGMAYVLIMHLSPNKKSALARIVQSKTKMPVHTVTDGMEIMPNNIYVIPPNTFMSIVDGHLELAARSLDAIGNFAVDYFLTALASVYKNNAIGVILSGTATDGTLGLKAIKAEGGITFAQDETAKFSGMPRNAYDSGYVDFLLPPKAIAEELARLIEVPYTRLPSEEIDSVHTEELTGQTGELKRILAIVKSRFGIDFFLNYKHASVYRRVVRRMVLSKCDTLRQYGAMLSQNPKEVDALYDDFLINVTSFFRDADFYRLLSTSVFPAIVKDRALADPLRVWVAGCSTGEEAYSIAIGLLEFLESRSLSMPIQIFATDLDSNAIEKARLGIYPASSMLGVSANFLKKYFIKIEGSYQILKSVRELCIFAQQNLLKDPPFSHLDLISCQNVLIYLETKPQARILQAFHYALKPNGFLFLGKSESIGISSDLFDQLDKKAKVFIRKSTKSPRLEFAVRMADNSPVSDTQLAGQKIETDSQGEVSNLILSKYVIPCIVINKNLMIVQFFGPVSSYLEPVTGKASLNILKLIRADLVIHLGSLIQKARKTERTAVKEGINTEFNNEFKAITIEVVPIKNEVGDLSFLAVFKEKPQGILTPRRAGNPKPKSQQDSKETIITKLEEQLAESRGLIRASNEEYETTYEELQAYNEEVLSSNEELQSVNEELETSKEELQSSVEELSSTNEELRKKNLELKQSQSYAEAIVETVHSPLLVLNARHQVRMANKAFYQTFKLTAHETEGSMIYELGGNAWEIPSLRENLATLMKRRSPFMDFELRHYFPGIGELVLDVNAYLLAMDDNSSDTLILLAFNNLSELLTANRDLKKVNEQLAEFAFISSHDLQEPLRKIQVFASFLAQPEANLNEFAKNYSSKINASSSRMSLLLNDLLSFLLLIKPERKAQAVDLNAIMKNVVETFAATIALKKVIVNVGELPSVQADPGHMTELFHQLLDNSLKFGKDNPVINVSCREVSGKQLTEYALNPERKYAAITVNDNGIGFEQKYSSKIFALFQRLDDLKDGEGSGVGLAICKKIVVDHGGIILADGIANKGATFTVILPEA